MSTTNTIIIFIIGLAAGFFIGRFYKIFYRATVEIKKEINSKG
jgi:uncharacterized membrane-anchored protein YhcB (DUF1043 family)